MRCNLKTVKDIFMNLGTNLKLTQAVCRETKLYMVKGQVEKKKYRYVRFYSSGIFSG